MEIIIDIVTLIMLSLIPATFNFFLDYTLGHPMSEDKVSTKAIFFRYSLWLAKRALPSSKRLEIEKYYIPMLSDDSPEIRKDGQDQKKVSLMTAGRKYFFYEQAIGMCPYCTNFWVSQIVSIIFYLTIPLTFLDQISFFFIIPIFSHTILRKL